MSKIQSIDLSVLISKSNDQVRESKESLFRALHQRNEFDYLVPLEEKLFDLLKTDPSVKMRCRDLLKE